MQELNEGSAIADPNSPSATCSVARSTETVVWLRAIPITGAVTLRASRLARRTVAASNSSTAAVLALATPTLLAPIFPSLSGING